MCELIIRAARKLRGGILTDLFPIAPHEIPGMEIASMKVEPGLKSEPTNPIII